MKLKIHQYCKFVVFYRGFSNIGLDLVLVLPFVYCPVDNTLFSVSSSVADVVVETTQLVLNKLKSILLQSV